MCIKKCLQGVSGGLPRHLVDILSGILYVFTKEYPQLTNTILTQLLIKNDFQPFVSPALQQQQQAGSNKVTQLAAGETQILSSTISKEQKSGFIKSLLRYVYFCTLICFMISQIGSLNNIYFCVQLFFQVRWVTNANSRKLLVSSA